MHDCACGIGTQVIGLAAAGYHVSGSDLSRGAVRRAASDSVKQGLTIEFGVSDMTNLAEYGSDCFDVLGAFDNALPSSLCGSNGGSRREEQAAPGGNQ
jgi:2-polyprenyl-3-methyl-5-hydroxy-6-metoxy-1,4-benzoquinol methylase